MLSKNKLRALYSRAVHGNVIADLVRQGFDLSKHQVIYQDTRSVWNQILVDRTGHFAGFSCLNERDLGAALVKVTRH